MIEPIIFKKRTSITVNILESGNPDETTVTIFTTKNKDIPKYIYTGEYAIEFLDKLKSLIAIDD